MPEAGGDGAPASLVESYHAAWTSGDIAGALALVDEDAEFEAPDDRVRSKADWERYLAGFAPRLTGAPVVARLVDGDRVALWYRPQTAATTTVLAAELFTVRAGRIVGIRLAFDRLGYLPPDLRP